MRKLIILFFILLPFICTSSANNLDIIESNDVNLIIDSEKISLSTPTILSNSHILFPLRELCDKIPTSNINLFWDNNGQAVTISYNEKTLHLKLNSNIAKINNTEVMLPCSTILYKNKTYVPLRIISEFLDCFITWDNNSKTAFIKDINDYFETKIFLDNLNTVVSNIYDVKIDIINEINNVSFGNSIYINTKENTILEKNMLNENWHESKIKLLTKSTLEENNFLSSLAGGVKKNSKLSSGTYYVYDGFFPAKSGELSKCTLYIDTGNLFLSKMISETKTDLGMLKQNVLFSYGEKVI